MSKIENYREKRQNFHYWYYNIHLFKAYKKKLKNIGFMHIETYITNRITKCCIFHIFLRKTQTQNFISIVILSTT